MIRKLFIAIMMAFAGLTAGAAMADGAIYTGIFNDRAVDGYDAVAYFTSGKPVKGNKKFQIDYKGAEWRFASKANMELFQANPDKYAPQYGGYCAWAMARGHTASGDPKQWAIVDGKLYLNYDAKIKAKWDVDRPGFIAKADVEYPRTVDFGEE